MLILDFWLTIFLGISAIFTGYNYKLTKVIIEERIGSDKISIRLSPIILKIEKFIIFFMLVLYILVPFVTTVQYTSGSSDQFRLKYIIPSTFRGTFHMRFLSFIWYEQQDVRLFSLVSIALLLINLYRSVRIYQEEIDGKFIYHHYFLSVLSHLLILVFCLYSFNSTYFYSFNGYEIGSQKYLTYAVTRRHRPYLGFYGLLFLILAYGATVLCNFIIGPRRISYRRTSLYPNKPIKRKYHPLIYTNQEDD